MQNYAISVEQQPVKNYWEGRGPYQPVAIVEHMMQGTIENTFRYFNQEIGNYNVSAHYGVARDGRVWQFVRDEDTAWANGIHKEPDSSIDWLQEALNGGTNLNTITIAIQYEGYSGEPLTEAQYEAAVALHRQLTERWGIPADSDHIIGHSRLDSVDRVANPGPAFPWERLFNDLNATEPVFFSESLFEITPAPGGNFDEIPTRTPAPGAVAPAMEEETVTEESAPVEVEPETALKEGLPLALELDMEMATIRPAQVIPPPAPEPEEEEPPQDLDGTQIHWASIGGGAVKVELANVRVRPSYEPSTIIYQVSRGTRLHFDGYSVGPELQGSPHWLHITREDGYGWVHSTLVQLDKYFGFGVKS